MKPIIAATFLLAAVSPVAAKAILPSQAAAAACKTGNLNNLARCFKASPSLATPYCSSFLAIPTVTVTRTSTPTTHVTLPQTVSTKTDVLTSTIITTSLSLLTLTTTATTYTTTTITAPYVAKRNPNAPKASPTTLACLTDVNSKSFTTSVSSACQCLSITPLTVYATATGRTSTSTGFTPVTVTTSTTTIVIYTTVVPTTLITTIEEIDVLTSTTTSSPPSSSAASSSSSSTSSISTAAGPPTCTPSNFLTIDSSNFQQFFAGSGVREPLDNPASDGVTPDVTTFPGTLDDCAAVAACIDYGYTSANNDYTFDIHYLIAEDVWSCNCFYQGDSTNYFTITDADVGAAYGYNAVY